MMTPILIAFVVLVILGAVTGGLLAFASVKLHVPIDPRLETLEKILPGLNCGACGFAGCPGYAAALLTGAPANLCKPGGNETAHKLAVVLGIEHVHDKTRRVAFVYCHGGQNAVNRAKYSGEATCTAALSVANGFKQCAYGCLGFGDCVRACQFDALTMTKNNTPVVDPEACTNCGLCMKACPKHLIQETIHKPMMRVVCSSNDKGAVAKAACSVACIGCGLCVKACAFQAVVVTNNLAIINAEKCTNCGACAKVCPTKAIS